MCVCVYCLCVCWEMNSFSREAAEPHTNTTSAKIAKWIVSLPPKKKKRIRLLFWEIKAHTDDRLWITQLNIPPGWWWSLRNHWVNRPRVYIKGYRLMEELDDVTTVSNSDTRESWVDVVCQQPPACVGWGRNLCVWGMCPVESYTRISFGLVVKLLFIVLEKGKNKKNSKLFFSSLEFSQQQEEGKTNSFFFFQDFLGFWERDGMLGERRPRIKTKTQREWERENPLSFIFFFPLVYQESQGRTD